MRGEDPVAAARRVAPYVRATHARDVALHTTDDGIGRFLAPVGEGVLDWPTILRTLLDANPELPVSIEGVVGMRAEMPLWVHDERWYDGVDAAELEQLRRLTAAYESRAAAGEVPGLVALRERLDDEAALDFIVRSAAALRAHAPALSTVPGGRMILRRARRLREPGLVDVQIEAGRVVSVVPADPRPPVSEQGVDLAGRVLLPGLVESHLHLDKAWLGGPVGGAGLTEAIAWTTRRKAQFTVADVAERAGRVAELAVANGTTTVRAHTEVDPGVGLTGVLGVLEAAERLSDRLRVQVAVFPQEGLACRPGTLAIMREALRLPGTVVGGCPYAEATLADARAHVETVLDLAVELGVPADLHLDLADAADDPRFLLAEDVARATAERGLHGRVAIGHVTTLAALPRDERRRVLDRLAATGVTVTVLPATDLHLSGRQDERNVRRGVAPLRDLWAAGVRTALSSNNVRNAFTPTGRADLLDIALLAARVAHVSEQHEFDLLIDAVSTVPAALVDVDEPVGLVPGARADLVVLETRDPDAVLLDQPARHLVGTQRGDCRGRATPQAGAVQRHTRWTEIGHVMASRCSGQADERQMPRGPQAACARRIHGGAHQFARPVRRMTDGRRTPRTIVASTSTAVARPTPMSLMNVIPDVAKQRKTVARMTARVVTIPPVLVSPCTTARSVTPSTSWASLIRDMRNTS